MKDRSSCVRLSMHFFQVGMSGQEYESHQMLGAECRSGVYHELKLLYHNNPQQSSFFLQQHSGLSRFYPIDGFTEYHHAVVLD